MHDGGCAGVAAAVLRQAVRLRAQGPMPCPVEGGQGMHGQPPLTAAQAAAIRHSHPMWLVERWLPRFGPTELAALLTANNRHASAGRPALSPVVGRRA